MDTNDIEQLRANLVKLAKLKEIPYTQAKIKKMTFAELEQVYNEHTANELDNLNETFADILIVKFDEFMKSYKWVKPDSRLGQKLQNRKLFKNDVKTVVSYFTPILPYLGLIEGGAVIVSEVMDNNDDNNKYENNDGNSCSTTQGDQQNSSTAEHSQHDVDSLD